MSSLLSEEKKNQVIGLGQLGWSLRRIQRAADALGLPEIQDAFTGRVQSEVDDVPLARHLQEEAGRNSWKFILVAAKTVAPPIQYQMNRLALALGRAEISARRAARPRNDARRNAENAENTRAGENRRKMRNSHLLR